MRSDGRPRVAVIGGGFSGATLAIQLKRRGLDTVVVESGPVGEGAAYRTRDPGHLLNIRAVNMSAWPERPRHFLDWLRSRGDAADQRFEPRAVYAQYLAEIWADEGKGIPVARDRAARVERDGACLRVQLERGDEPLSVDAVVLATGNPGASGFPGGLGAELPADALIADPWSSRGMARLGSLAERGGRILALGTGLTLIDVAVTFSRGAGQVIALSRRGLLPQAHTDFGATPAPPVMSAPLRQLGRTIRAAGALTDWRPAVDGVRPSAPAIWRGWSVEERRRFLRHAGPWWSIHRRRTAPDSARTVARMTGEARLQVEAGRLLSAVWRDGAVHVRWRLRGTDVVREAAVDALVNCTGFDGPASADPLQARLLADGLARADPLGLGLAVDEGSRMLDGQGRPQADLLAVGPPTKGAFWEIVAVPEIRVQVSQVADQLAELLTPARRVANG